MITRLDGIFIVSISILVYIVKRLIISSRRYNMSIKRDICRFDCHSNFLVSIAVPIDNWNGNVPSGAPYITAFNSTSRYVDDLLNTDNNFSGSMVKQIYHSELQVNEAIISDTESSFLDLHLPLSHCFIRTKIYDKGDFDIVNILLTDG